MFSPLTLDIQFRILQVLNNPPTTGDPDADGAFQGLQAFFDTWILQTAFWIISGILVLWAVIRLFQYAIEKDPSKKAELMKQIITIFIIAAVIAIVPGLMEIVRNIQI